ncbi:MAG: hypothetical protein ACPHCJ_12945 [Oceanococcaceae bacterium]
MGRDYAVQRFYAGLGHGTVRQRLQGNTTVLIPKHWLLGDRRMRIARRCLYLAIACSITIVAFVSNADRGAALAVAGQCVLALLVANLALVVWEVRLFLAGCVELGLDPASVAHGRLRAAIRQMVSVLGVMLIAGSALMLWARRLLPVDPSGEFALLFWVLLASGFGLSIYVAELISHLIHAFEALMLQMASDPDGEQEA